MPVTPGWRFEERIHTPPCCYTNGPKRFWPGQLSSLSTSVSQNHVHFAQHRTYVCMYGKSLPYSPIPLFLDSHKLLRVHRPGSRHLHSAQAWFQSPDTVRAIYPALKSWSSITNCSLQGVAQVPIFSCKSSLLRPSWALICSWQLTELCCPVGILGDLSEATPRALLGQVTCSAWVGPFLSTCGSWSCSRTQRISSPDSGCSNCSPVGENHSSHSPQADSDNGPALFS